MKNQLRSVLLATAALASFSASAAEKIQTLPLDVFAVPRRWSPAESTVSVAKEKFSGRPVLKWEAPVDHFKGEAKYLIGWPRTYFTTFKRQPQVISDWSSWDNFEFEIRVKLEKDDANKSAPISLHFTSTPPGISLPLRNLHDGKLHTISVPTSKLKDPSRMSRWGFSISESNYKHGAKLTVWAGNFRLTRSSECTIKTMTLATPAVISGKSLKLQLLIAGPSSDVARGIPFEVKSVTTGRVIRRETLPVQRGEREIEIDLHELDLEPGNYTLTAFPASADKKRSVTFQVVGSPFEVKK